MGRQKIQIGRAQAEDNLKVRPPRKITLEPKNKTEFLFRMDKTYYSILGFGDIQEENKLRLSYSVQLCLLFYNEEIFSIYEEGIRKKGNKLGLSSAKLRAPLASPARSIHLSPSLFITQLG